MERGKLFVVATPLGHLDDITLRALATLRAVDLVAAEDTRHTRKLLSAHGIAKPLLSCWSETEKGVSGEIIAKIRGGLSLRQQSGGGGPLREQIIRAFDAGPNRICHALAVNDGGGDCGCANCRAMDAPDADANTVQLTDRYVKFMNAVAEKVAARHPDKLIGFLSYASVKQAPSTVKPHKNLVPFYCAMARGLYPGWDEWMAAGVQNMGHYGYHDDRWFTLPKINPRQEARRIRYMAGTDVFRGYYKEFNPTYPLDGHAAVVCADMMWDPILDENVILARYYSDLFGESAPDRDAAILRNSRGRLRGLAATHSATAPVWPGSERPGGPAPRASRARPRPVGPLAAAARSGRAVEELEHLGGGGAPVPPGVPAGNLPVA